MEEYGQSNEYGVQEYVMQMMIDLVQVAGDLLGVNVTAKENGDYDGDTDENYGGPFFSLSKICINILSSPICGNEGANGGGVSSNLIRDCVKSVYVGGVVFMSTCPSTQVNLKRVTSVMLEDVFGPEHMYEQGGDSHVTIDDSDSDEVNSDEDCGYIGVFTSAANLVDLDLKDDKNMNGGCGSSDDDAENNTNQSDNDEQ